MATPYSLHLLGGLSLRTATGGPAVGRTSQRRRLALLAVLAAERRPISRDRLLGLFWPEVDEERARHLLADSLYVLRAGLGEDSVLTTGDLVALNDARVASDVGDFLGALEAGTLVRAVELYTGPFLDGIFVSDAPEFERWADSVRDRLAAEYRHALERLAGDAATRGDQVQAVRWWRQLAAADPVSSRAALGLMSALAASGDRAAALRFARVHENILMAELEVGPDPAVAEFATALRAVPVGPPAAVAPSAEWSAAAAPPPVRPLVTETGSPAFAPATPAHSSLAADAEPPARPRSRWLARSLLLAGIVMAGSAALSLMLATGTGARSGRDPQPAPATPRTMPAQAVGSESPTIAVLPFAAIGRDSEATYVAEGISDALTRDLARLRALRVASHASSVAAAELRLPPAAIGDTLRVRLLVQGRVQLSGDTMHVAARLSDAHAGTVLWSRDLEGDATAEQAMHAAQTIAREIATTLAVDREERLTRIRVVGSPPNTEAYDAYLRGRHLWNSRNPEAVKRSIRYLELAIARDSTFAAAYAGLADSYVTIAIGNVGDFRADDYFQRARLAARTALALDSEQVEAHATLGYIALLHDLDWEAARRELSRALDLGPSNTTARIYQAILFEWTGHFEEAVREAQYVVQLDPISPVSNIELGRALLFARRYDEAAAQLRATLDLDSLSLRAHLHLGQVYVQQRRFDDGIRELRRAAAISPSSRPLALLAHAYALAGRRGEALALLDTLHRRARRGYVPAFDFAIVHAGLGDLAQTYAWLDLAFADHSIRPYLMDPTFDALRADRRYRGLLARLHLPWPAD